MADSNELVQRNRRLLRNHDTLVQWIQHLMNWIVIGATLYFLVLKETGEFSSAYRVMLIFSLFLVTIIYNNLGVFRQFNDILGGIQHLARAWGIVVIVSAWVSYITTTSKDYSQEIIIQWVFAAYIAQALVLSFTYKWYQYYRRHYRQRIPALIIGTGRLAEHLAESIDSNIWLGDKIIGLVSDNNDVSITWNKKTPLLGSLDDLLSIVKEHDIRRVYVALPIALTPMVTKIQDSLADSNLDIVWAPDIFEFQLINHSVREVAGVALLNINETPLMAGGPAFIKLLMDKCISFFAIIILSPLLTSLALAVKLSSPGPIIFKQARDGWDGRKFTVYKFRSMHVHEAKEIVEQAKKNDSRVTVIGKFIRKTSLDELPQLFNVLEGTMSLVGPRPHAVSHNVYYSNKVKAYLSRHRIKPGITGLAQINGCRGETGTIESMVRRVEYDLEYIRSWSPWLDFKILVATPMRLIRKPGNAY